MRALRLHDRLCGPHPRRGRRVDHRRLNQQVRGISRRLCRRRGGLARRLGSRATRELAWTCGLLARSGPACLVRPLLPSEHLSVPCRHLARVLPRALRPPKRFTPAFPRTANRVPTMRPSIEAVNCRPGFEGVVYSSHRVGNATAASASHRVREVECLHHDPVGRSELLVRTRFSDHDSADLPLRWAKEHQLRFRRLRSPGCPGAPDPLPRAVAPGHVDRGRATRRGASSLAPEQLPARWLPTP